MLQIFTATKDETCYQCHCTIPEGTRYWAEQTSSGKRKKQHTNCDMESIQHQVTELSDDQVNDYFNNW